MGVLCGNVCVCVVLGVGGAWAFGDAVVPSRCFLWWSEVSLFACCDWTCGVGTDLFLLFQLDFAAAVISCQCAGSSCRCPSWEAFASSGQIFDLEVKV